MTLVQDDGEGALLVGLDLGTSRIKAGVYGVDGRCISWGASAVPTERAAGDRACHDPEAMWAAATSALRAALRTIVDKRRIAAIACASVGEAALLVDAAGRPLTPILAWFDRRGVDICRDWTREAGSDELYALTGQPPEPILSIYKLEWLRRHCPDAYASAAAWVTLADYMAFRLCGVLAAERSLACRSGVLAITEASWSQASLEGRGLAPKLFRPLQDNGTALATVAPEAAMATHLPVTCVVGVGGYDQALAALVCSGFGAGTLSVTMGSTEAQVLPVAAASSSPGLNAAAVCQGVLQFGTARQRFLLSGIYTAGSALEWARQTILGGAPLEAVLALAEATPPGSHGVGFLPQLLVGSGTGPTAPLAPNGAFWGLGLGTDRGALVRAVLEGLAYEGRLCTETMVRAAGVAAPARIRAVGGDTQNRLRLAIKAAVAGVPIQVLQVHNASGLGAALMGGLAAGLYHSVGAALAQLALPVEIVTPDPGLTRIYDRSFERGYRRAAALLPLLSQEEPP